MVNMACAKNFYIKDTHYSNINYKIPCRYCMNCRIDRRRQWKDRAEYEFKKHISGAFVTFTYNDAFLPIVIGNDEKARATLRKNDAQKLIERIRKQIERHPEKENILRQKDFTYIGVGEYGENGQIFDRPHYHILFMGLDFAYNKKLFLDEWKYGFIDALPILNGGINYVLKYMDKQIMGKEAIFENFGRYGLEAPKQFQSKGFGNELYYKNYENALKHNGNIKSGMKNIIVPPYYKQKMGIITNQRENTDKQVLELRNYYKNKKILNPNKTITYKEYQYQKNELQREYQQLYERREQNLLAKASLNGEKVYINY